MPMQPPFSHVGFLHFGTRGKGETVAECEWGISVLRRKLQEYERQHRAWRPTTSLLVLPEGFNVRDYNRDKVFDCHTMDELTQLSLCSQLAFVVALIEGSGARARSRAYLIDGEVRVSLGTKGSRDSSMLYELSPSFTPTIHRELQVASLICLDATDAKDSSVQSFDLCSCRPRVLCVPASSRQCTVSEQYRGKYEVVVFANSDGTIASSITTQKEGVVPKENTPGDDFIQFASINT